VLKKANAGQPSVSVDKTPGLLAVITHDFFFGKFARSLWKPES
jgi:hypothetical protein